MSTKQEKWDRFKLYVVDFKSSKKPKYGPYEEWGIQTAAYRSRIKGCEGNAILRLDKATGYPDWYDLSENYENDLRKFELLDELWHVRNPEPVTTGRSAANFYFDSEDRPYVRQSKPTDQLDKSGPLIWWAVTSYEAYLLEQVDRLARTSNKNFIKTVIEQGKKEYRRISKEALDIGSEVHDHVRWFLTTQEEPKIERDEVLSGFIAFLEWLDNWEYKTVNTETTVFGDDWAGTYDWLVYLKPKEV